MQGRFPGHTCRQRLTDQLGEQAPLRTPGHLGHTDAHDPNTSGPLADSPGPLGVADHAAAAAVSYPRWLDNRSPALPPLKSILDLTALREMITRHEGKHKKVQADTRNRLMVGIGFALDRPVARDRLKAAGLDFEQVKAGKQDLTDKQIETLFQLDLHDALHDAPALIPGLGDLPEEKQRAVVALVFHLGADGFRPLKRLIGALVEKDYERAAEEIEHAVAFAREGTRAKELAALLRKDAFARPAVRGSLPRHRREAEPQGVAPAHTGQPVSFSPLHRRAFEG
jgi:GH24 family phage-related lysozyme (muramidase)